MINSRQHCTCIIYNRGIFRIVYFKGKQIQPTLLAVALSSLPYKRFPRQILSVSPPGSVVRVLRWVLGLSIFLKMSVSTVFPSEFPVPPFCPHTLCRSPLICRSPATAPFCLHQRRLSCFSVWLLWVYINKNYFEANTRYHFLSCIFPVFYLKR